MIRSYLHTGCTCCYLTEAACRLATMLVITDVVCLVRLAVFAVFIVFCAGNIQDDRDYCKKDQDRCDDDGVYEYIAVTNYEDYKIRDTLDDDFELISIRPKLAFKKTEKTLQKYPNR